MEAYGKRVLENLKGKGLDIAEDALGLIIDSVIDELIVEVKGNDKAWDDIAAGPLAKAKELAHSYIDKIDGKVG